ncbi:MAG TPA: histidine kinase [Novosphingobium sp.]|nr:histidine kinase [Novosphingobium sp.]
MDLDTERPEAAATARVPLRLVVISAAALWACYYLLTTMRGYVVGLEFQDELAGRRLLVTVAGFAVTLAIWPLLRQLEGRRLWLRITAALVVMLPAALLIATINALVFADMEEKVVSKIGEKQGVRIRRDEAGNVLVDVPDLPGDMPGPVEVTKPNGTKVVVSPPGARRPGGLVTIDSSVQAEAKWRQITDIALGRYFLLLAWAALYLALGYAESARAAERREGAYRRAAKAAELRSLRYQVNPHFLFNTLNSLSALVLTGKTQAAETMIQTISVFYRRSLAGDPTADVPLDEEIRLQRLYLEIEAVRFPERLKTAFAIPSELGDACVPGMILQPLVENSVKYAVAPLSRPVTVTIAAREEHGRLVLTVSDDGPGRGSDARMTGRDGNGGQAGNGWGIGLQNVRERLAARFGAEASVVSGSTGDGYATIIRLPLVRDGY